MKVIVIGGVAAGPKAASKIAREMPEAEIVLVEKGPVLSYAGCGLPYFVSGEVGDERQLTSTPIGVVRDSGYFQNVKRVQALTNVEALEIDRSQKQVRLRDLSDGTERVVAYDKLLLATGAKPVVPEIPGIGHPSVFTLHSLGDARRLRAAVTGQPVRDAVIIGGGLIGVEAAEALASLGARVVIVERLPRVLSMFDGDMSRLIELHLESKGVQVVTQTAASAIESAEGSAVIVQTTNGAFRADVVVLAVGVRPNSELALMAGLSVSEKTGGIVVNQQLQTSDPDIFAAGDCVECTDRITGRACYVPLGSTANKQGRVAAVNICGGSDVFPGVLGTTVCKVFDYGVARTGLTEQAARELGFDVVCAAAPAPDKAHYMPQSALLLLKLVADRKTGRLLGAQAVGPGDGAKRIDVAATAISASMAVDDLANLDLAYAPPYAPAMDNLITAANVIRNKINGRMCGIAAQDVKAKLERGDDFCFLDVRSPGEYERVRLPRGTLIPLGMLRRRLAELPREREIVVFCQASLRGYEASLILKAAGFDAVRVFDGGVEMWPYEKITGAPVAD